MLHEAKMKFWVYEKIRKFQEKLELVSDSCVAN